MSSNGSQAELSLNKLVLSLNVEQQPTLDDSFSSDKDSKFNEGAVAFLSLVESAIKQRLVQPLMSMTFSIKMVETWSVAPSNIEQESWDINSLFKIG